MESFVNKVFHADARRLLAAMPTASVDAVITDAMYGTGSCEYDWGCDPAAGDPDLHWEYHEPIYHECLRVLKPGGALAWGKVPSFFRISKSGSQIIGSGHSPVTAQRASVPRDTHGSCRPRSGSLLSSHIETLS